MTIESLKSEIDFVLGDCGEDWHIGRAALNDFLRGLHEIHIKSDRNQVDLLAQVQTVFGSTVAHHLAEILGAKDLNFRSYMSLENCPLYIVISEAFRGRGIAYGDGIHFYSHFTKALDEERSDRRGNSESPIFMLYQVLGDEAAYHLGGLYVGDAFREAITELQYLDSRVKRFVTLVDRWKMEIQWELEDQE